MVTVDPSTAVIATSVSGIVAGDPHLPKDLWPNIVLHLPQESIENVMFVCQYFRTLAQPQFFRTLAVKPYGLGVDSGSCSPRNEADSNWISQKLQFYSSPMITRHIHVCRISPHRRRRNRYSISPDNEEDSGRVIVNDVFDLLPNCPNLTELDLDCVRLTAENLRQISRIPRLHSVVITCCSTTSPTPVRLCIKTVLFKRYSRLTSTYGANTSVLLSSLLSADVTESLCFMSDGISVVPYDVVHMLPLHCLHTLCIDDGAVTRTSFSSFLSHLPSLREIIIRANSPISAFLESPLPPLALPLLEAYEGPLECMYHIAQGRPIRHLRILGANPVNVLLGMLRCFKSTVELESLQFQVDHVNITLLDRLFDEHDGFPELKALGIEFDIMDYKVTLLLLTAHNSSADIKIDRY
jgi:hypothetical protein